MVMVCLMYYLFISYVSINARKYPQSSTLNLEEAVSASSDRKEATTWADLEAR